jgi:transcriptional regulator GlxA family with amidase domain
LFFIDIQMKTKFTFLVLPQMHLMDLAGPDQAIHEAIDFGADFTIEYCQIEKNITTSAGLPVGNLKHFSQVEFNAGDFLIIPGANTSYLLSNEFKKQTQVLEWIRKTHQAGVTICSICVGAFVLAECGLLDNIPCTTHFKKTQQLQTMYPLAKVTDNILFTQHNNIYTSAGVTAGIDLTLHLIEQLKDSHFAHLVARELVVYNRRNGDQKQESELLRFRNHIHSGVHKVQDWIIDNIDQKVNLNELAEIACMSERNFTRIFKKETVITVNDYITVIRKEKIKEFLKNPDLTRSEIASFVGLQSERQLSRLINAN